MYLCRVCKSGWNSGKPEGQRVRWFWPLTLLIRNSRTITIDVSIFFFSDLAPSPIALGNVTPYTYLISVSFSWKYLLSMDLTKRHIYYLIVSQFYHIICDWFTWWSSIFFFEKKNPKWLTQKVFQFCQFSIFCFKNFRNWSLGK